jgi:hypothetical protein
MGGIAGGETRHTFDAESSFGEALALMKGTGANQVKLPTAAGVDIVGVSFVQGDASDLKYRYTSLTIGGPAEVVAAEALVVGDLVIAGGSNGRVAKLELADLAAGQEVMVLGQVVMPASGAAEKAVIIFAPFRYVNPAFIAAAKVAGTAAATAANYGIFYVADRALILTAFTERHEVAGSDGGAVTLMLAKVPSGTAKGAGTDMLAAGVNLKAAADTNQAGALHATPANYTLAAGDALALVPSGTLTAVAGVTARAVLKRV